MSTISPAPADRRADAMRQMNDAGRRLSDAIVLFHTKAAESVGLSASETKVLGYVQRFGPMTHRQLTERIGLKPASVTNILDRLEDKGWVLRKRSSVDGRNVLLTVDPVEIAAFREKVFAPLTRRLRVVYDEFGTEDLMQIARAFDMIAASQEDAAREIGVDSLPYGAAADRAPS
ncbi:MAG: MarR family winged helix-turn-helix transcriptional regulator [Paracoccaceae bacterium]